MTKAVILLSGGLDSTTCAAWALRNGFSPVALSLNYGQRQQIELASARAVAARLGIEHRVIAVDLATAMGGSALTDATIEVPKDRDEQAIGTGVPITYVPARNTILLSLALGLAETLGARHLIIGVNALDCSGYPDCRGEFLRAFETLAGLATKAGTEDGQRFEVVAPLLDLTKAQIVRLALDVDAPLELTHSCYDPGAKGLSCGRCDACQLRLKGFSEAGTTDPIQYVTRSDTQ
jgi:7-cyano-7-deazaguanine synthase